ncbi:MAG: hypothetical protein IPM64_10830 [Phycisphaerales bacterium]|nr:hypothetical protein [Phycisphaerales bacterium]
MGLVVGNGNSARTTLTWDAENRLRSFGPTPGSEAGGMTRVEFRYDYLGRRVEKAVFEREAAASRSATESTMRPAKAAPGSRRAGRGSCTTAGT